MKTPERIKKDLEDALKGSGNYCPYKYSFICNSRLIADALDLIQQLEEALLLMVYQYCQEDDSYMSHRYMVAGEHAFAALGIENYCSIDTIEKRLDEMEGIHKTPLPEPPKE
jgi:hypothetical protein